MRSALLVIALAVVTATAQTPQPSDASKLDERAVAIGLEWDAIDTLVTDLDPADVRLDAYRRLAEIL